MKRFQRKFQWLALTLAVLSGWPTLPVYPESSDYAVGISQKFGRGLLNVLSSPLEIPCGIRDEVSDRGAAGMASGLFVGIAYFVRRILVGVTEAGTFMIPMEGTLPAVCAKKAKPAIQT